VFKRLLTPLVCGLVLLAATFTGLINAIRSFQDDLKQHHVKIWVRRAGPNYQQGLKMMRECARKTGLDIRIYGPESHVTAIVPLALGLAKIEDYAEFDSGTNGKPLGPAVSEPSSPVTKRSRNSSDKPSAAEDEDSKPAGSFVPAKEADHEADHQVENFTAMTRCVVYGLQQQAVQGMLDFDHMCRRSRPSVAAIIFPYSSNHLIKLYWGTDEILLPVYQSMSEALSKHPEVTVIVNFASFRSVFSSVLEVLDNHSNQIRTVAIIAEGVPESQTRMLIKKAKACNVGIIGPATVGGIKPGCFRIGKCSLH
jgi:ATP citrate (pro-S)-lyase